MSESFPSTCVRELQFKHLKTQLPHNTHLDVVTPQSPVHRAVVQEDAAVVVAAKRFHAPVEALGALVKQHLQQGKAAPQYVGVKATAQKKNETCLSS